MALAGKNIVVSVSTAVSGTYTTVVQLKSASMEHEGTSIDISDFSTSVRQRVLGLIGNTYSLTGFYSSTDTNGQTAIRTAWSNGSTGLWVKILWDGSTGFKQQVIANGMSINGDVDGPVEVSYSLEGTGAVTATS